MFLMLTSAFSNSKIIFKLFDMLSTSMILDEELKRNVTVVQTTYEKFYVNESVEEIANIIKKTNVLINGE